MRRKLARALKTKGETLDYVSCFPSTSFVIQPLPACFDNRKKRSQTLFFVKYDKLSLLSAINTCDKDVTKMENEEWEMEIEKWEIVVIVHTILKFGSCCPRRDFAQIKGEIPRRHSSSSRVH